MVILLLHCFARSLFFGIHLDLDSKVCPYISSICSANYFTGVEREFALDLVRENDKRWIRQVIMLEETKFLVICMTQAQGKYWREADCIEMDMSWKMVAGDVNVVSFDGIDKEIRRMLSICLSPSKLTWFNRPHPICSCLN